MKRLLDYVLAPVRLFLLWRARRHGAYVARTFTVEKYALKDAANNYVLTQHGHVVLFEKYGDALKARRKGERVVRVACNPKGLRYE